MTLPFHCWDSVHVEGETAEQVGTTDRDSATWKPTSLGRSKAHATVFIAEYASQGILVTGEVKTPGMYPALGVRMFNDVMTAAGGVTAAASSKVIITRRDDPDHPITVDYNPEALTPVIPRIQIFPGDTITVPRAGIVYVLGRVNRAGRIRPRRPQGLSVETAMALAAGSGPAAAMNRAHLVRTLDDGRKEDIILDVNRSLTPRLPTSR